LANLFHQNGTDGTYATKDDTYFRIDTPSANLFSAQEPRHSFFPFCLSGINLHNIHTGVY
jgi:hypothetical protein